MINLINLYFQLYNNFQFHQLIYIQQLILFIIIYILTYFV